jgi:hypothetical protein
VNELVAKNIVDRTFAAARLGAVPANVHAEWRVDGRIHPARLARGAAAMVHEHPLLRAREVGEDTWVLLDAVPPPSVSLWSATDDDMVADLRGRLVSRGFDLRSEPPVRVGVIRGPASDHVLVVADHALVDGIGVGRTAVSLMSAYTSGRPAEVDTRWRDAHELAATVPSAGRVREIVGSLQRRTVPTAIRLAPEPAAERERPGEGIAHADLSPVAAQGLASVRRGPSTSYDVVVAAFCLAGMRWNRDRGRRTEPFSVGVPLNLRRAGHWFDGVCNATLQWPVRVADASPGEVLDQVSDQLRPVRSGVYSPDVRALLGHLSDRTHLSLRERHALATTTVVSIVPGADLARTHLPSQLATASFQGSPPAPPTMGMTFGVVPDRGAFRLAARYRRSRHTPSGAMSFLESVDAAVTRLCRVLETSSTVRVAS